MIFDKYYPLREVYPSSADWGSEAWTLVSLDEARKRLEELTK